MGKLNSILTPEDLKKGELVEPGWYPVEYVSYEESEAGENAKNPGSTNIKLGFKILKDGPFKDIVCTRLFNETALGFGKALWPLLGMEKLPNGGFRITADQLEGKIGHKLMIYVQRGKSNQGNEFNDVKDFRPLVAA